MTLVTCVAAIYVRASPKVKIIKLLKHCADDAVSFVQHYCSIAVRNISSNQQIEAKAAKSSVQRQANLTDSLCTIDDVIYHSSNERKTVFCLSFSSCSLCSLCSLTCSLVCSLTCSSLCSSSCSLSYCVD